MDKNLYPSYRTHFGSYVLYILMIAFSLGLALCMNPKERKPNNLPRDLYVPGKPLK